MRHLQIYTAIATIVSAGSVRKAAEKLAISPSALNRQVLAFETQIGVPIFDRMANGLKLSTAGEVYYRSMINHLAEMERAAQIVSDLSGLRRGKVSIVASPELLTHFLPSQVSVFRQALPGVQVAFGPADPETYADALTADRADLALIVQPVLSGGVETLISAEVEIVALCEAPRPLRPGLEALLDDTLVLPPPRSGLRVLLDLYFRRKRIDPRPAVETHAPMPPCPPQRQLQPWLSLDLPTDRVPPHTRLNLPGLPGARVALLQREGRPLPLAAARFAAALEASLTG